MFQEKGFIEYCNKNQISDLVEFKKHIFIDYGVPYITITESQFIEYLNLNPSGSGEIVVEHLGKYHKVKTTEDLIELGIESKYISFDLLETFCRVNPDEPYAKVSWELSDRNIKLSSDEMEFYVDYKYEDEDIGRETNIKSMIKHNFIKIDILELNEVIYILSNLAATNEPFFTENDLLQNYSYSYIKKIINTGILKKANEIFYFTQEAILLIKELKKYQVFNKNYFSNKVVLDNVELKKFCYENENTIQKMILKNKELDRLLKIIKKCNEQGIQTMSGIAYYCNSNNLDKSFLELFIGERATNGLKPLEKHTDICFNCNKIDDCTGEKIKNKDDKYKSNVLLEYRNQYSQDCLKYIIDKRDINNLVSIPIFLKFLTAYDLVVSTKLSLKKYGILKDDKILYKNRGEYCPDYDTWRLRDDLLVQKL